MSKRKRLLAVTFIVFGWIIVLYLSLRPNTNKKSSFSQHRKFVETHPVSFYLKHYLNGSFMELLTNDSAFWPTLNPIQSHVEDYLIGRTPNYSFPAEVVDTKSDFNIEKDVIVFLHIQKTGGTIFNRHLVENLILERPCNCSHTLLTKPCYCLNTLDHVWLYSWFTIGWPCGLHADWTELHDCVDGALDVIEGKTRERRYFYVTLLRDPIQRYISEWQYQRRGHHWQDAKLRCKGKRASMFDVRPCFRTRTWIGVTFDEFLRCRENLARNRQTRMIADLTMCDCYHRDRKTEASQSQCRLESALRNIQNMSFFGIMEYQHYTQQLFEYTFNLNFNISFQNGVRSKEEGVTLKQFYEMLEYIGLDIQLYQYAKSIFLQRVNVALKSPQL